MLCRQPDVKDEFVPYGLADTARDYLNGSPAIVRRILKSGKTWRAYIVASGAVEPSDDDRQLMEEMAMLADVAVASRATFNLAASYRVLHPRAARNAWVACQMVDDFELYWCRSPQKTIPHRVWSWRNDSQGFTASEAIPLIERVIHPSRLGEAARARRYPRWQSFDYEEFSIGLDRPSQFQVAKKDHSSFAISFRRFQLRPRKRTWANLPAVKSVAASSP